MTHDAQATRIGVVLIGRNEGERLVRALHAARRDAPAVVYVDSGSTDGSVAAAEAAGAEVVRLDTTQPFTAARARNAGFERLRQRWPEIAYVQFIDGDCELVAGWLATATAALDADPKLAAVCGRRRERHPEASVYNRLIDLEWNTPVGPATACGGDVMWRASVLASVGGYDPTIAAGEEPQLCMRVRAAGGQLQRLDHEMTLHDAAITRLAQWWQRDVRTGRGSLDVATRFPGEGNHFGAIVRRARVWAVGWPVAIIVAFVIAWLSWHVWLGVATGAAVALLGVLQIVRQVVAGRRRGLAWGDAAAYGVLGLLGKFAQMQGQVRYLLDRVCGRTTALVEYKAAPSPPRGIVS